MSRPKELLRQFCPHLYQILASVRFFLKCKFALGPCQDLIAEKVFGGEDIRVLGGPFEGMAYYNKTIWGTITSKWLGCYELELQPVIAEMIRTGYPVVVDVGAAEGYYAVGLAWRMPGSRVITYDTDPIARFRQRQLAALNKISNLEILGNCSAAEFNACTPGKTVLICDIEGYEEILLDPLQSPPLRGLDILVEIHRTKELGVEEMAELIKSRFNSTHDIQTFHAQGRDRDAMRQKVPALRALADADVDFALSEGRYEGQVWLWMKSLNKKSQPA